MKVWIGSFLVSSTFVFSGVAGPCFAAEPFEILASDVGTSASVTPFQMLETDTQPAGNATVYSGSDSAGSAALTNNPGDSVTFRDRSTASSANIVNNTGGAAAFNDQTTAASSFITNNSGATLNFNDNSTAADSRIVNNGGGYLGFGGESTAGSAVITNNGSAVFSSGATADNSLITNNGSGTIRFEDSSTAGQRDLTNNGTAVFADTSSASDVRLQNNNTGTVLFQNGATAGRADINNSGALGFQGESSAALSDIVNNAKGTISFSENALAGDANIANNGSVGFSGGSSAQTASLTNNTGASIEFSDHSSAATSNIVNAGTLAFSGTSSASAATILTSIGGVTSFTDLAEGGTATLQLDKGSTLDVAGIGDRQLGLGSFTSAGIVELGRTRLTLTGNAVLNDTSSLGLTLGYGQLMGNAIELQGGSLVLERGDLAYAVGQTYRILDASSFTGSTFNPAIQSDFAFLDPRLSSLGDTVTLDRNSVSFLSVAETQNQQAVATAIDGLSQRSGAYSAVVGGTIADALEGFDQLSGEIHASALDYLQDNSRIVRNVVMQRARSMGAPSFDDNDRWQGWITALGSVDDRDTDGNAASGATTSYGTAIGVERAFGYNLGAGIAASYEHGQLEIDDRNSNAAIDTVGVAVYGAWQPSAFGLRAGAVYQQHQLDVDRDIDLPGLAGTASTDNSGWTSQFFAEAAYDFLLGDSTIEPFAGVAYRDTELDGFQERGVEGADLYGSSGSVSGTVVNAGVRAQKAFLMGNGYRFETGLSAAWSHSLSNETPSRRLSFLGGMPFDVFGPEAEEEQVELGARFGLVAHNGMTFNLIYGGLLSKSNASHAINLGAALKF